MLLTGIAKIVGAVGSARILQTPDPVLYMSFRKVFLMVGGLEVFVAFICFWSKHLALKAGLVAWLVTNFLLYRLALLLTNYHKPCSCMGNLTDALHISPQTADTAMKIILAYLLIGSYAILFWLWRQRQKQNSASSSKP